MAERRMFAKTIIDSDAFLEMPVTARLLYYDLSMRADDDGFVNSPKKIMRIVGASADDLTILVARKFIIPFDVGVVVIKHWRIHNYIRKDMYHETKYKEQKAMLGVDENGAYRLPCNEPVTTPLQLRDEPVTTPLQTCNEDVTSPSTQVRLGKVRKGKDKEREESPARDKHPDVYAVKKFAMEQGLQLDAQAFIDYYEANGWRVGKNPMKDWRAAVRNWARRDAERQTPKAATPRKTTFHNFEQRDSAGGSWEDMQRLGETDEDYAARIGTTPEQEDGTPWDD